MYNSPSVTQLAKYRHLGKSFPVFDKILTVYFLLGKMLNLLWQIRDIAVLIFSVANGQILKKSNHLVTLDLLSSFPPPLYIFLSLIHTFAFSWTWCTIPFSRSPHRLIAIIFLFAFATQFV